MDSTGAYVSPMGVPWESNGVHWIPLESHGSTGGRVKYCPSPLLRDVGPLSAGQRGGEGETKRAQNVGGIASE